MLRKIVTAGCLAALLSSSAAFAQATAPAAPAGTPPFGTAPGAAPAPAPATTPYTPSYRPATRPAPQAAAPLPSGTKVNLNTASAAELNKLPKIGKARAKVIMDERAKSPFRDWTDFDKRMQRTSVNNGVKGSIKDMVAF